MKKLLTQIKRKNKKKQKSESFNNVENSKKMHEISKEKKINVDEYKIANKNISMMSDVFLDVEGIQR